MAANAGPNASTGADVDADVVGPKTGVPSAT